MVPGDLVNPINNESCREACNGRVVARAGAGDSRYQERSSLGDLLASSYHELYIDSVFGLNAPRVVHKSANEGQWWGFPTFGVIIRRAFRCLGVL